MTTTADTGRASRRLIYVILAVILGVVLLIALLAYRGEQANAAAEQKADQLIAALNQAALPTPSRDQIVRVLGDDGGAVCADPRSSLTRATLYSQLSNGSGGPGQRPVIVERNVLRGELEIIKIYCPAELASFQQLVDDLKSADVVKE